MLRCAWSILIPLAAWAAEPELAGPPAPASLAAPSPALTLTEAIDRALDQNLDLVRSALGVRGARLGVDTARSDFRLRIRPDGAAATDQDGNTMGYGLSASRKIITGTELTVGATRSERKEDGYDRTTRNALRVDLTQPLFRDFGALVQGESIVQAQQQLRTTRRSFEEQRADLVVQVVESFETLIQLERKIASDLASWQRMDKLYRLTHARERQGRASRVDTLRVDLQRGQAQSSLEDSQERYSISQRTFAELLGLPPDSRFTPVPPPLLEVDLPTTQAAVAIALSNRLDYAQVLQDYEDTVRGVRIAERGLWPALSLKARFEQRDDSPQSADEDEQVWSLGLSGDSELIRATERARLGQASLNRESAREAIRIREWTIAREVQEALTAYQRARSELGIAERNYTLAEKRARLARRLFERGRGDNFSVTDAEESFSGAEVRRLSARAEASATGYRLLRALGVLVEMPDDLKPHVLAASSSRE